jgi:putative ABC transport system permease protein
MPAGFDDLVASQLYQNAEMWTPLGYDPAASFACRTCRHLRVFAKLNDGVSPSQAVQELGGIIQAAAQEHPKEYDTPGVKIVRLSELFLGPVRPVLMVLAGGVVLLLLVACGNVANLLLIRATEREQELAVRTALGVTTSRLVRQLMTESLLLAFAGAAVGIPLAALAIRFVVSLGPSTLPRLANAALDARTLAASLGLAVATGLLFGLAPVWQIRKRALTAGLKDGSRRTASARTWRLRSFLVAGNMAMAAVLIVSSGLVVRSLLGLLAVDTGFDPEHVLTLRISLAGPQYSTPDNAKNIAQTVAFYDQLLEKVRAMPGVEAAAGVTTPPLSGLIDGYGLHVDGRPEANPEAAPSGDRFVVTPDYFRTMRIPLKRGRLLEATDRQGASSVIVVNETLARELFPNADAIGQSLRLGGSDGPPRTIVGIAGDVRHLGLEGRQSYQVYVPQSQWVWAEGDLTLVVRTTGEPLVLTESIRQSARDIDLAQPVTNVAAYADIVRAATGSRRIAAQLLGAFAALALILATIGLYGALGVLAGQRRQEIGVRMALGAAGGQIGALLLAQGLRPALAGLAAGLGIVALAGGVLESLLYGVTGLDPVTFALSAAVLVAAALLACALPVLRASRVNPALALRAE